MTADAEAALLEGLTASAFLDSLGRFAKAEDTVTAVRLFYTVDDTFEDLSIAEFNALTLATRDAIKNTGSAAGLIDTEGKSNA